MDVANEILDAIEIIVDKKIREQATQIYSGVCKSVNGDSCVMFINGKNNTIQFYGPTPIVGAIYKVFVPYGNMSSAFAITGIVTKNDDEDDKKDLQYSNPNLLDNWYFGNPVNQRGQTEYTGAGYGLDRWKLNGNNTMSINDDGVKFGYVNNNYVADQPLEYIADGVYTISVLFGDNTLKYATFKVANGQGTGETSAHIGWLLRFASNMARIIYIGNDTPEITIKAAKLELGSQQTLAHQDADGNWVLNEIPDYGEQLARCQRYFQLYSAADKRLAKAVDCRPVMRADPSQGTIVIGSTTYYYNTAEL